MKKIVLIIAIIVVSTGLLCGCTNSGTLGDTDKVELVEYSVTSQWQGSSEFGKTIRGTVKNIGGELIDNLDIEIQYCDSNSNILDTRVITLKGIPNSYTKDFLTTYGIANEYYENIDWDNLKFKFTVS